MTSKTDEVAVVLGYGVPRDITKDEQYSRYLLTVFNALFERAQRQQRTLVFSGGPTDCFKPYRRTEAGEMIRAFRALMKRPATRSITDRWRLLKEAKSISTLENLLFTRDLLRTKKIRPRQLTFFCETTRVVRVRRLAREVFGQKNNVRVHPVDFDSSPLRYIDADTLKKRERIAIRHAQEALKSKKALRSHHDMFAERLKRLRRVKPAQHQAILRQWQEELVSRKS